MCQDPTLEEPDDEDEDLDDLTAEEWRQTCEALAQQVETLTFLLVYVTDWPRELLNFDPSMETVH